MISTRMIVAVLLASAPIFGSALAVDSNTYQVIGPVLLLP